jgi:hypothetical protein
MSDVLKYQIHTVLVCGNKRQGVALGNDGETGQAIKIWLMTPKAVGLALQKLAAVANAVGGARLTIKATRAERSRQLDVSRARSWALR